MFRETFIWLRKGAMHYVRVDAAACHRLVDDRSTPEMCRLLLLARAGFKGTRQ